MAAAPGFISILWSVAISLIKFAWTAPYCILHTHYDWLIPLCLSSKNGIPRLSHICQGLYDKRDYFNWYSTEKWFNFYTEDSSLLCFFRPYAMVSEYYQLFSRHGFLFSSANLIEKCTNIFSFLFQFVF